MKEEFNLSKYVTKDKNGEWILHENYVKEFIRLFKQELDNKNKGSSTILSEEISMSWNFSEDVVAVKKVKQTMDDIKNEIDNAQEDCANLDWISKEQALKIINKHLGKDLK